MELTKEELELVKIKREETAQLKAEYQEKLKKDIQDKKEMNERRVSTITHNQELQITAARRFVDEMSDSDFTLFIKEWEDESRGILWDYDYQRNPIRDKDGNQTKTIASEIKFTRKQAYIKYKNQPITYGNLYVMVTAHDYGEYRMRINGIGYKTENKSYKRVSTVMDKVKTHYERKNREEIEDRLIKEFIDNLMENPPYQDSVVKRKMVYQGGYRGNSYNKFMYSHEGVEIILQNGIKVECKVVVSRNEAMLIRHNIVLPDKLGSTTMDVLECLNKVEFQVNKEEEK
tara:strand:+ start:180 stop:1043 length:864 start_codon:yes stop_codon:yes gene_type:complete